MRLNLPARWKAIWRREEIHSEIAEEREFHIAMRAAELTRRGMPEDAARKAAREAFGPGLRMQEAGFDLRGGGALDDLAGDLRLAFRILRKAQGKTAAMIATVALGIGITTAVVSVIRTVVLDPLPFADTKSLAVLHQVSKGSSGGVSYPNFEDWRAASHSFEAMAVFASDSSVMTQGGEARRLSGAVVSANLFRLLRVTPLRGRLFNDSEDEPGSGGTVLISDALWRKQFQGREDVLGQFLVLDGTAYRVIGVIPASLAFPVRNESVDYWITIAVDAVPSAWGGSVRQSRSYPRYEAALGRLKPGVSLSQAQAEMNVIADQVARAHPGADLKGGVRVGNPIEDVVGEVRPLLWTLFAAVLCVLGVSTANAATLQLVSATVRSREFALRAALGARPERLARQLIVEGLVLALAGGGCGALLAGGLVELFASVAPANTPRIGALHANPSVLLYAVALSVVTGLLFAVAPAATLRTDLVGILKAGARGMHLNSRRPSTLLIAGQIALSTVLGCSTVALTNSFWKLLHTPRGFDPHQILTALVTLPPTAYSPGSEKVSQFYAKVTEQVRRLPGVVNVGLAQSLPLSGQSNSTQVEVIGAEQRERASADLRFVNPEYFGTMRIALIEGRYPEETDRRDQPQIAIVNRAFAARFLQARPAVGSRLHLGWGGDAPKVVVGVVDDILHNALSSQAAPEVYVPLAQFPLNEITLVVRTSKELAGAGGMLRESVRQLDPAIPVENVRTLEEYLLLSVAPQRFLMWVLVAFAASTLLLAAIGLYGALSFSTVCRRHEFGIRMALGSDTGSVMRLVLRQGLGIAAPGLAVGLLLVAASQRFLSGWLYRTSPFDVTNLATAGTVLLLVAMLACWGPARRATRVDPVISLRGE